MGKVLIGEGFNYDTRKESKIYLSDNIRKRHTWVFGTTGVGKTRLMEHLVVDDIMTGKNCVIIDPKTDVPFFSKVVQAAALAGRMDDLMFFTPIYPQYSFKLNPIENFYMIEEIISHILSGVDVGTEKFFFNVANEASTVIVRSLMYILSRQHHNIKLNFEDIKNVISHTDLKSIYKKISNYNTPEATLMANDLNKIIQSGADYYNKISSSLRVALMDVSLGNMGEIMGKMRGNELISRLESGKKVIFVGQVGSLLTNNTAYTAAKILISMIKSFVGRVYATGKPLKTPLSTHFDEAGSILTDDLESMLSKVGSANMFMHCYSQSIAQIISGLNINKAKSILDNINTKIYMKTIDAGTGEYAAEHFGQINKMTSILNVHDGSVTMRETTEQLLTSTDFSSLQPREFYMISDTGKWKGMTTAVPNSILDVEYPKIITQ